jgi:aminopeptidase N
VPRNLTREEAAERSRLIQAESYLVELDLTGGPDAFRSVTTVRFGCTRPGTATFVNLAARSVAEMTLNGVQLPGSAFDRGTDRIALPALAAANELRVVADCAYSRSGEGLHRFSDPADQNVYLYSDLETFDAHRIFACFDQPDLKARFEFVVTAEPGWQVISNMAPAAPPRPAGSAVTWRFPPTPVMSTYITAVAAGPYHEVRSEHDGIGLGIFCRQSLAQYLDPEEIFEVTRQGFDYFHRAFSVRYPFGKYDQLFVPEFKEGAMENAGCVTFTEHYVFRSRVTESARESRAETILHEMAHMWFGDLVTMRWWDDLWLNESFATWAGTIAQAEATRWPNAWTTFAQVWKAWAYRQDQLPSTHPVAADIPDIAAVEVNFDGITYAKGAAVLKQLVAYVGLDNFLAGVRSYFTAHAWRNATLGDLLAALEQASGRDLSGWSKAWLETAGVNTLRPEYELGPDGSFASFAVSQEAPASHPVLRPHRIAIGLYDGGPGGLTRRRRVETDISGDRTEISELAGERRPDLVLINDDDLTYAKIRLDGHSLRTLVTHIADFTSPLPAALCWAASWDMCRDAEMRASDYLNLVLAGADSIADIPVLQTALQRAAFAVRRYGDQRTRDAALQRLAAALRSLLSAAEPGSDKQLCYAQALAGIALAPQDLSLLSGLLDGSAAIDGLAVDTELRWALLARMVSRGAAGGEAIDAELERDRTDAGERHAAACRAAIPQPASKQAAWDRIVSGQLPNALFRSTLGGFQASDQDPLLAPLLPRYYQALDQVWRDWGTDMAQYFTTFAFPVTVVSQEGLAAADAYLARPDIPAPARRLVSECRDDLARALRCREADATGG